MDRLKARWGKLPCPIVLCQQLLFFFEAIEQWIEHRYQTTRARCAALSLGPSFWNELPYSYVSLSDTLP